MFVVYFLCTMGHFVSISCLYYNILLLYSSKKKANECVIIEISWDFVKDKLSKF